MTTDGGVRKTKAVLYGLSVAAIFCLGFAARFINTFSDNTIGLFYDEAMVAKALGIGLWHAIQNFGLVRPLFLLGSTKMMFGLFGNVEVAARLIPFSCAALSLGLFFLLVRLVFNDRTITLVLLSLFSFNVWLINHAGEFKAYSYEVLLYIVLLMVAFKYATSGNRRPFLYTIMLLSVLTPLLTFSMVFILPGIFALILFKESQARATGAVKLLLVAGGGTLGIIGGVYSLMKSLPGAGGAGSVAWYRTSEYFRQPGQNPLTYYLDTTSRMVKSFLAPKVSLFPGQVTVTVIVAVTVLFLLLGLRDIFYGNSINRQFGMVLLSPPVMVLLCSLAGFWPYGPSRANLFLVPGLLLLAGSGIRSLRALLPAPYGKELASALALVLCVLLVPFDLSAYQCKTGGNTASTNVGNCVMDISRTGVNIGRRNLMIINPQVKDELDYYVHWHDGVKRHSSWISNTDVALADDDATLENPENITRMIRRYAAAGNFDNVWIVWDNVNARTFSAFQTYVKTKCDLFACYPSTVAGRIKSDRL